MSPKVGAGMLIFGIRHGPFGHDRRGVWGVELLPLRGRDSQQQALIHAFPPTTSKLVSGFSPIEAVSEFGITIIRQH
jgi:hypothetical protein